MSSMESPDDTILGNHGARKSAFRISHPVRQQPFNHGQPYRIGPAIIGDIAGLARIFMVKQDRRQPAVEMHQSMRARPQNGDTAIMR